MARTINHAKEALAATLAGVKCELNEENQKMEQLVKDVDRVQKKLAQLHEKESQIAEALKAHGE